MRKLVYVVALLLVASCGGDDGDGDQAAETTQTPAAAQTESDVQECEDREIPDPEREDGPGEEKPDLEVPDGAPPCELVIDDVYEGTGDEVQENANVVAHYVGVSWSTGEEFDTSWSRGEPTPFSLLSVIPGWTEGIPGMREGGRRRLIIPPDLAYGAAGRPGIAPNETLIFVVDIVDADGERN